jgi:hypothetical protein
LKIRSNGLKKLIEGSNFACRTIFYVLSKNVGFGKGTLLCIWFFVVGAAICIVYDNSIVMLNFNFNAMICLLRAVTLSRPIMLLFGLLSSIAEPGAREQNVISDVINYLTCIFYNA